MMKRKFIALGTLIALMLSLVLPTAAFADFINTTGPTGTYYQYANFSVYNSSFKGGQDVDSFGDLLYVNRDGYHLDVYQVTLNDSDSDGVYEPDQHPDNPDATGPMEQRTLTYIKTYDIPDLDSASVGEIYAAADRVYFLGQDPGDVYQYVFSTGVSSKVIDYSGYQNWSHLGYDDVNNEWYASNENSRSVYKWNGSSWVLQFTYASLAGSHMDGLEVVTDPTTNIPYVYVSDMTSNYIGQWRYDKDTNAWVEQNLFAYNDVTGSDVEGMGFGALGHFWATGWNNVYEIGGGDLGGYVPKVRNLSLSPGNAEKEVGSIHNVTATALLNQKPVEGIAVSFTVTGANSGSGTATTDSNGQATFSYTGSAVGTDTIVATSNIDGQQVNSQIATCTWKYTNLPPVITKVTGPTAPTAVNTQVAFDALFTDPNTTDTHTATWDWGDGTGSAGTINESNGAGTANGSHVYSSPGVYMVTVTVTDNKGLKDDEVYDQYIVIYDPDAGFVTGGGWIESPAGAYRGLPSDPEGVDPTTLTGKATFGFVSKYLKGANVPTGNTTFVFHAAGMTFKSVSYDWLVVAGSKAQFKGTGSINGSEGYSFMLTAVDGQLNNSTDTFRIKIWNTATGKAVYDNQLGAADIEDPSTILQGGSIVIHK